MSYIPHSDADRKTMLEACNTKSIDDLFSMIPEQHRFPDLDLPSPLSELEILQELQGHISRHGCESRNG